MTDSKPTDELLDRLIDEALLCLADGRSIDLDRSLAQLPDEEARSAFRVAVTAEEFLHRRERGEGVPLQAFLERLEDEKEREGLRRYLDDSRRAGRFLPRGLAIGEVLSGKYRIVRELGRGGTAVVYEGFDESLERRIALKVFNPESNLASAEEWEAIVLRESKILASLSSRSIVHVLAAEREGEHSFIAMDFVSGRDLSEVLGILRASSEVTGPGGRERNARLRDIVGGEPTGDFENILDRKSWYRTVARIGHRAALALEKAHEAGVLHRDLKPSNIVLVPGGEPVLLDFGLASGRAGDQGLVEGGFYGTIEYLAPEQARDLKTGRDPRTDVYQLGLVLYELLTLRPAFARREEEPLSAVVLRKREGEVTPPGRIDPRIPKALEAICLRALTADVESRYGSAGELREDLALFLRGLPPRFAQVPIARKGITWTRFAGRRPAVVIACLAVLGVVAIWIARGGGWRQPVVSPFTQELTRGAKPVDLELGQTVLAFDDGLLLGVKVLAPSPTYLYAFIIEGGETPETRVLRPCPPEPLGQLHRSEATHGPLRVEANADPQYVVCSYVTERKESHEGILVYACETEVPFLQEWQDRLAKRLVQQRIDPIYYPEAIEMGKALSENSSRGESGADITDEQRRLIFGEAPSVAESDGSGPECEIRPYWHVYELVETTGE